MYLDHKYDHNYIIIHDTVILYYVLLCALHIHIDMYIMYVYDSG